ncbi:MAG: CoA pyrophosphatase [Lautropia sp.]
MPLDTVAPEPLPAVTAERLTRAELRRRFAAGLSWQPELVDDAWRTEGLVMAPAAVLIPLINRPAGLGLLLTLRSASLTRHSGQVAFPGGRVDPDDASATAAALREAHEEVGLAPARVEVLGALPEYRTGTGYAVTPVVGLVDGDLDLTALQLEPREVAEVFEVPLGFLMDPANHQRRLFRWLERDIELQRRFFTMPWRPDGNGDREYFIWGATAAMLRNLYRFLAAPLPNAARPHLK